MTTALNSHNSGPTTRVRISWAHSAVRQVRSKFVTELSMLQLNSL